MARLRRIQGWSERVSSCGLKEGSHLCVLPKAGVSTRINSGLVGL